MATYESVVLVKQEVFVYKIPPRSTNRGYRWIKTANFSFSASSLINNNELLKLFPFSRLSSLLCRAADWNLNEPTWNGRMRMVSSGPSLNIKLEDKVSGQLFANCPVEAYPGVAIEPVSDSSRYFVLRIQDDNGRSAFIGTGFGVSWSKLVYTTMLMTRWFIIFILFTSAVGSIRLIRLQRRVTRSLQICEERRGAGEGEGRPKASTRSRL